MSLSTLRLLSDDKDHFKWPALKSVPSYVIFTHWRVSVQLNKFPKEPTLLVVAIQSPAGYKGKGPQQSTTQVQSISFVWIRNFVRFPEKPQTCHYKSKARRITTSAFDIVHIRSDDVQSPGRSLSECCRQHGTDRFLRRIDIKVNPY